MENNRIYAQKNFILIILVISVFASDATYSRLYSTFLERQFSLYAYQGNFAVKKVAINTVLLSKVGHHLVISYSFRAKRDAVQSATIF